MPDTPMEPIVLTDRERALRELTEFLADLWKRPAEQGAYLGEGRR
jgi:hypothetical protein